MSTSNIIHVDNEIMETDIKKSKKVINNHNVSTKSQGMRLNITRRNANFNLRDFGNLCGIEPGMLGRYERGSTEIHSACVLNVCLNLREQKYYADPEWILHGKHEEINNQFMGLGAINESSEIHLKSMKQFNTLAQETIDKKYVFHNFELDNNHEVFNGSMTIVGSKVNLNQWDEIIELNCTYCSIELEKSILAKISFDAERNLFVVDEDNNDKPYSVKKEKIKNLMIVHGFWNNDIENKSKSL